MNSPEYIDELLRDDFYLRIIKHEKFNPRLIEWLSSFRRIRDIPIERYQGFVENLLRDPSEIWRHAYEQEITDAGRSMLLTIFSLGGKASKVVLRPAFSKLHDERARRYGFLIRPEDFRSALREVAGAFIKPVGDGGVEVIDPSVLDLLNAVVRDAPDNAIDIVVGAVSFDQIERILSFGYAESGKPILEVISRDADRLVESVKARVLDGRRINFGNGAVGYRGSSFEHRLKIIIGITSRLLSAAFGRLITPLFKRLLQEWETERLNINDTVELLRTLEFATVESTNLAQMKAAIEKALYTEVSTGCGSDELREFISVIDTSTQTESEALSAARSAFEYFRGSMFANELRECRSRNQYDGILEDLDLFREELGVNVDSLVLRVEETKAEFEQYEDERADQMHDEWKERGWEERNSERSVSDMFGSLKGDRE